MKRRFSIWLVAVQVCLVAASSGFLYASDEELLRIQESLDKIGDPWVAGRTPISELPDEEKARLCGAILPDKSQLKPLKTPKYLGMALPAHFDWRSNNGNWVTPVRDQMGCGACWAFAATAVVESASIIRHNKPGFRYDLSEQHLISCSGAGNCSGGSRGRALNYYMSHGVPDEYCLEYEAANAPCSHGCSDWQPRAQKISGWDCVTSDSAPVETIKAAVYEYPVCTLMLCYDDFLSYQGGIYVTTATTSLGACATHAVVIIGWDDDEQYWIGKDSRGTDWGEDGFFRIRWGEVYFGYYSILVHPSNEWAGPDPSIEVETDWARYFVPGDIIQTNLFGENRSYQTIPLDVYIALVTPNAGMYTFGWEGWSSLIRPWFSNIYLPGWFSLSATPMWLFELPCASPPIETEGEYGFAAAITWPETEHFIGDISWAIFDVEERPSTDITMLSIPAGSFLMSETEVTQKQWMDLMGWNDSCFSGDDHPVEEVTWFDCVSFCNKLSQPDGYAQCYTMTNVGYEGNHISSAQVSCNFAANGYRLPTEAEWEYACRAGTTATFYWDDSDDESVMKQYCWYIRNAHDRYWTDPHADEPGTQSVGQKIPNSFGLYDMHGNVWEWYSWRYYGTRPDPDSDPTGASSGSDRVLRGGSWGSIGWSCRSAHRGFSGSDWRSEGIGFRLVRSVN